MYKTEVCFIKNLVAIPNLLCYTVGEFKSETLSGLEIRLREGMALKGFFSRIFPVSGNTLLKGNLHAPEERRFQL